MIKEINIPVLLRSVFISAVKVGDFLQGAYIRNPKKLLPREEKVLAFFERCADGEMYF